jgi:FkbM family methyltransferase
MNPRKLFRLLLLTRNLRTALCAWRSGIPWLHLERRGKTFVMKGTDIPCEHLPSPLPEGLSYQIGFLAPFDFKFEVVNNAGKNSVLVDAGKVRLWLDGADVTFIVQEVFGNLEYGAMLSEPAIVVDIGMNVGIAALYFAREKNVRRVIAFEPFAEAVQRAERNLALNPEIAPKIEIKKYALGEFSGPAKLEVDPKLSTLNKIARGPDLSHQNGHQLVIEMRDAESELQSVLAKTTKDERVVLKMDCEGSEREIFQRLSSDTVSRIDAILLEWHHSDILEQITQKLNKHGFRLLVRRSDDKDRGMLYAFRK